MCLVKVKQEEDVVVPYRVVRARSPSPHRRSTRVSRTYITDERRSSRRVIPAPAPLPIPTPQPVPVFVQPPPPPPVPLPPPATSVHAPQYVEVSPRSSVTSHSDPRSDLYVHEREYRRERRDYSPARSVRSSAYGDHSPRYETFRYIDPPEERYARRDRSKSRDRRSIYTDDPRASRQSYRERVIITDDNGRRRTEYRR